MAGLTLVVAATVLLTSARGDPAAPLGSRARRGRQRGEAGGQAGGIGLGIDYGPRRRRAAAGARAIVGVQNRRGDVLDYIQIACARPTCTAGGCRGTGSRAGPAAGNPAAAIPTGR